MVERYFYILNSFLFKFKRCHSRGSAMITGTIIACAIVGVLVLKSSNMSDLSFSSFAAAGDVTIAQEYALSRAEFLRAVKYAELNDVSLWQVNGSNGFYEEVSVADSVMGAGVSGGTLMSRAKI